ncbi:MAG: AEC family transporter [Candidatus Eisenbacteria bacterium]
MNLLNIVLPVFLIIGLGYALRRGGFLGDEMNAWLSRLVFYVTAPALLVRSMSRHSFDWGTSIQALLIIGGITAAVSLTVYVLARGLPPARRGVLAQACHRSNTVFIGLPIVLNAYGEGALASASIVIGFMVLIENFFAVLVLTLPHDQRSARDWRLWTGTAGRIARNPLIIACVAGMLYSMSGLPLPTALDRSLAMIGTTAAPLGLLCVGASLEFRRLPPEAGSVAITSLVRLIIHPALIYVALGWLGLTGAALGAPVLIMACPTAVVSYIMAYEMGGDSRLAAALIIGTTAVSVVTLIGWLALLKATPI